MRDPSRAHHSKSRAPRQDANPCPKDQRHGVIAAAGEMLLFSSCPGLCPTPPPHANNNMLGTRRFPACASHCQLVDPGLRVRFQLETFQESLSLGRAKRQLGIRSPLVLQCDPQDGWRSAFMGASLALAACPGPRWRRSMESRSGMNHIVHGFFDLLDPFGPTSTANAHAQHYYSTAAHRSGGPCGNS